MNINDVETIFHDLTPVHQDDGAYPVCAIAYSSDFKKAMNYFRAVLKADEQSERAFQLTTLCLKFNPANYTIWHYRRRCVASMSESEELLYDLDMVQNELEFAKKLGGGNPKNYQIWYHRHALLEPQLIANKSSLPTVTSDDIAIEGLARKELEYIEGVLCIDAKNYHAWSHRQWVLKSVDIDKLWLEEKSYVNDLIQEDPRNNSAWNGRWFASHRGKKNSLSLDSFEEETQYAIMGAVIDPYNESPWRYLIGLLREQVNHQTSINDCDERIEIGAVMKIVNEVESKLIDINDALTSKGLNGNGCVNLISAHVDILQFKGDKDSISKATSLTNSLATQHDVIRKNYWSMREKELLSLSL